MPKKLSGENFRLEFWDQPTANVVTLMRDWWDMESPSDESGQSLSREIVHSILLGFIHIVSRIKLAAQSIGLPADDCAVVPPTCLLLESLISSFKRWAGVPATQNRYTIGMMKSSVKSPPLSNTWPTLHTTVGEALHQPNRSD